MTITSKKRSAASSCAASDLWSWERVIHEFVLLWASWFWHLEGPEFQWGAIKHWIMSKSCSKRKNASSFHILQCRALFCLQTLVVWYANNAVVLMREAWFPSRVYAYYSGHPQGGADAFLSSPSLLLRLRAHSGVRSLKERRGTTAAYSSTAMYH